MTVVYFTSNASTGAGSLVEAVKNAQPGDVVRPDETVFERGSTIEIALASTLTIDKNLTLDASPFRVRLDGGGTVRCANIATGVIANFTTFDFVNGATTGDGGVAASGALTLERCGIYGCSSVYGGGVFARTAATLSNCVVTGCRASGSGGGITAINGLTLSGATVAGNVSQNAGFDVRLEGGDLSASNSIIGKIRATGGGAFSYDGSVVDVASSAIGFVASPPDDLSVETWNANAWRSWDLRLLDDASGAPSPYRDAGSVDNMSRYDVQGAFRGRETDGVATCSPGAYETIQADLFWVGEPFPQEMVDAAPQNVRIANYCQTTGSDVYFEADMTWEIPDGAVYSKIVAQYKSPSSGDFVAAGTLSGDATGRKSTQMREGSRYIVRVRGVFKNGDYTAWAYIDFVARAALDDADGGGQTSGIMLPSPLSVVNPSFLKPDGWATSRFATASSDAAPQIGQTVFVDGNVRFVDVLSTTSAQTFGLTVGGGAVVAVDAASRVYFDKLQIALGASFTSTATAQARTSTRCGAWSRINSQFDAATPCDFDAKSYLAYAVFYTAYIPNAATYGALKVATAANDMIRLSGEYVCDVFSTAQNGTATDQTIRVGDDGATIRARQFRFGGDGASNYVESFFDRPVTLKLQGIASVSLPSTRRESWADDFLIDVTDATSATLTLSGQTVCGDAPNAAVELSGSAKIDEHGLDVASLTLAAGATLSIDGGSVCVAELNVAGGATVAFSPVATDGTAGTDAIYVDAILSATTAATVGAATFTGVGYFATPQGTGVTAATFAEDVRACDYGAEVKAFAATATGPTEAAIEWSATDETATLCVERKTSSGWEVVDVRGESGLTAAIATPGATVFRAFDGAAFWSDSAWFLTGEQFTVETDFFAVAEDGAESVEYETETHIVTTNIDKLIYWGQSLTFLARIRNAFTGDLLLNDGTRTKGVRYSLYRREGSLFSTSEDDVPVRLDVDAGAACLLETAQTSDAWPGVEYNFALIPANSADEPLIPAPGNYVLRVFVELTTGNPIVFVYTFAAR